MATDAILGAGTLVQRGDGASPEVFTTIGEVRELPDFGEQSEQVEVTHLESTAKEYIPGLPDGSTLTMPMNYNPDDTTHSALKTDFVNKTQRNFRVILPDTNSNTFTFTGIILGWSLNIVPNDAIVQTMQLKISGSITGPTPLV